MRMWVSGLYQEPAKFPAEEAWPLGSNPSIRAIIEAIWSEIII